MARGSNEPAAAAGQEPSGSKVLHCAATGLHGLQSRLHKNHSQSHATHQGQLGWLRLLNTRTNALINLHHATDPEAAGESDRESNLRDGYSSREGNSEGSWGWRQRAAARGQLERLLERMYQQGQRCCWIQQ